MRRLPTGLGTAWLLAGLACALPAAPAGAAPETERWVPALAVFGEVLAQQAEQARESAADLGPSGEDLRVLALVDATDGSVTLLVPQDETGHWVAEIAVPDEAPLQRAGSAEPDGIPPGPSGEALVASPVVVAAAEPGRPTATSAADEVVEPIPPVEPGETGSAPEEPAPDRKAKDETERWVPAFSIYSGVVVQEAKGTAVTSAISSIPGACVEPQPTLSHCDDAVRPSTRGDDLMVTPFVSGSFELMTPGLASVPGRPRLFVHGDAAASFAFTRDIAKEGLPEEFEVAPNVDFPSEETIRGQGSATTAEVKPLLISAGAGVAFTVEVWERRLRIKPSVEYLREEIEVTGVVNRAVLIRPPPYDRPGEPPLDPENPNPAPTTENFPDDDFRLIELRGGDKRIFHGVGPGLEIELDAARAGPLVLAVYLAGQAYAFLGDLEMEFSDTNEYGETATWQFEKNRWGFRGGVGLRFRWVPE